ncbi:MAG: septal ring lytic transglycosylase RlpA family protein [Deltaproteobacteria bacterium]|nr:septal ring lytic transglycosylase RlpA family protein [Deltaproteobacteria bacterium]
MKCETSRDRAVQTGRVRFVGRLAAVTRGRSAVRRLLLLLPSAIFVSAACGYPRVTGNESWLLAQGGRSRVTDEETRSDADLRKTEKYRGKKPIEVIAGRATYYSDSLAGNRTASGERYDPRALTAASRDLPFGTIVRVVRDDNKRFVIIRINDRGPFRNRDRILDLSRAAAEQLDMIGSGVVEIRAEILAYGKGKKNREKR